MQTPAVIKYNATYFSTLSIMDSLSKLDKDYDSPIPISQSSTLRELNVLINNLKLKISGDIDLFSATINVSILLNRLK